MGTVAFQARGKAPAMLTSLLRTLVPIAVGYLLSLPVISSSTVNEDALTGLVTAIVSALYYAAARALERYVSPKFGWLLGAPVQPTYGRPTSPRAERRRVARDARRRT